MKKILLVFTVLLLVSACGTTDSNEVYTQALDEYKNEETHTENISIANILATDEGELAYDNIGVITYSEDAFEAEMELMVPVEGEYEDIEVFFEGDSVYVVDHEGEKHMLSSEEFANEFMVARYEYIGELLPESADDASITDEGDKVVYEFEGVGVENYLTFSTFNFMDEFEVEKGTFNHKVIIEDGSITKQEIYLDMEVKDEDKNHNLIQRINLSFISESNELDLPDFSEFN